MENTKDFSWFEEEAVKAVMTNDLSFSDKYYKKIDMQVTEEMHRILECSIRIFNIQSGCVVLYSKETCRGPHHKLAYSGRRGPD